MITAAEYCSACEQVTPAGPCEIHGEGMRCMFCDSCEQCDAEWFDADEREYDDD